MGERKISIAGQTSSDLSGGRDWIYTWRSYSRSNRDGFYEPAMRLTLQSQLMEDVVVIRCRGRIVAGDEVDALLAELEKQTKIPGTNILTVKRVVLQLAEADYIDSSGLGALVRLFGVLRAAGGDLKLCELSPVVLRAFQVTNLLSVFPTYPSEREAIDAFSKGQRSSHEAVGTSKTRIVCIDTSSDLLAYVNALLKRSGYEIFTTRYLGEAMTLVNATQPRVVICGPGVLGLPTGEAAVEKFRQNWPNVQILHLPSDFSTAEAGQAGVDLVNRVQSLLTT
jgi:anti-anti-sigma factor